MSLSIRSIEADEILKIDGGGNFFGLADEISKDLIDLGADPQFAMAFSNRETEQKEDSGFITSPLFQNSRENAMQDNFSRDLSNIQLA